MKKKLTILFALLCASVMGWATDYCHTEMTTGGKTIYLTCQEISAGNYQLKVECNEAMSGLGGSFCEVNGVGGYQLNADGHFTLSGDGKTITCDIASSSAPRVYTPLYVLIDGEKNFGEISDASWAACGGGSTPDPDPDPTPDPDPNSYTAGGHTITLDASYVGDIYTLVITSADDMTGLGGSFWNVNGVGTDMRSNSGTNSYTVSGDKKTITCQVQSSSAPNIYTPLYVLMPGEVNFGNVTLNWEDRTPITSEYCNYQGPETQQDGHYYAITWETDPSGNVVITIGNGTDAGACSFRNGGFEGDNNGLANFVVSDDDFATTTPATDYFTVTRPSDGDLQYVMTKIADLPANAKIKHLSAGAIAWKEGDTNRWCFPEFIYTYGGTCNQLDAPTNVAIDGTNHITFDAVAGADSYMAYVSLGGVEKYSQTVASGDELTFVPLVSGDYTVNVIASGAGKVDSDPSADYVWQLVAAPIVLGNSEYCEKNMSSGNTEAAFTWETDGSGNIVITISEILDGANDPAHFRANAFKDGLKVGTSKENLSNYFNIPATIDNADHSQKTLTYTLKDPANAPAPGEKIYYNGVVEYRTSENTDAWPTLDFEWTYGTVCSGKSVSASVNNNTMGTAVVQKAGVDVTNVDAGDEVTFIATSADPALYRFVNWTKGGVEVSTSATYVATITETTNLVANFDYIRDSYCHYEVLATGGVAVGKKLYMTLGSIGGGKYQIRFDGSAEAPLTGLQDAAYTINWVKAIKNTEVNPVEGQDVPFTKGNDRWNFNAAGYGCAWIDFELADGKTIDDIFVWNNTITFNIDGGLLVYQDNQDRLGLFGNPAPKRHNIDWNSTCSDAEAPVFGKAEAEVLNESSVRLMIQATDNWGGLLTYTIARADASDIILNGASGEELTQEVTGLTTNTEYDFTITVSDGVNDAVTHIVVTPIADNEKPVMTSASLESKTWNSAIINVAATDNKGVTAYYVVEKDADYVATEGKITIDGLTAATAYTFHIQAKDAAGNISDNQAEVSFTTDAHFTAPQTAALAPTWPTAQVKAIYSPTYSADCNFQNWESGTGYAQEEYGKKYTVPASGYFGSDGFSLNCLQMEKLHYDIWIAEDATLRIVPICRNSADTGNETEYGVFVNLIGQQWNSIDLALNAGDFANVTNWSNVYQVKIDNASNLTFWVANAYFYRETAYVDGEVPTNVSASTVAEGFYSVQISAQAEDNSGAVSFKVKNGDEVVANGAAASAVATTITINNLLPGMNYNFSVVASDEAGNEAAPVAVAAQTKALPAPAPVPDFSAKQIVPVFTDATTCTITGIHSGGWGETTTAQWLDIAANDKVFYVQNFNYAGWHSWGGGNINATGMQYLHVDVYSLGATSVNVTPISAGHEGVATISLTPNAWTSYDVPLSDYDANNIDWANIFQFKFMNPVGGNELMIDNVYFWKAPKYTRDDDWMAPGELGTVCYPEGLVVTGATMYQMAGTDANGKFVFDEVDVLEPGVPYLFEAHANALHFYATAATPVATAGTSNGMVGTFEDKVIPQNSPNIYYFSGTKFYAVTARSTDLTVPAYRAYVDLTTPHPAGAPRAGVRRVVFDVQGSNAATGFGEVQGDDQHSIKVLINGHLFIRRGEKTYDATGSLVK